MYPQKSNPASIDLIDLIYEAAINPELWSEVLVHISQDLKAQGSVFFIGKNPINESIETNNSHLEFVSQIYVDPRSASTISDYNMNHNDWLKILTDLPEKKQIYDFKIYRTPKDKKDDAYLNWLKPKEYLHGLSLRIIHQNSVYVQIAVFRLSNHRSFSFFEFKKFSEFFNHFKRAGLIHKKFYEKQIINNSYQENLNLLPFGIMFFSKISSVLFMNNYAQNIIIQKNGLFLDDNRQLCASELSETPILQELIKDTINSTRQTTNWMLLHRKTTQPLAVIIHPLNSHVRAVMFIFDTHNMSEIDHQFLVMSHNITVTEAKIVAALINGANLKEISIAHNVTIDTVRKQLKSVFQKTGTNSQLDLARLILRSSVLMMMFSNNNDLSKK